MGATSIVVSDNGDGISPSNYEGIGLKHCTSKISDFDDLDKLSSFGFRGEAVNALCELSESVTFCTRQMNQDVGSILKLNRNGS